MNKHITIKDLYNWAKENNAENLEVVVQHRDGGGDYFGADEEIKMNIGYYSYHYDRICYSEAYAEEDGYKKVVIL